MKKMCEEAEKIMTERFGKDMVIALATVEKGVPCRGINLGYFGKEENHWIAKRMKEVFSEWIDNGHTDFGDENTVILCVELTDGLLLSHGRRYEF